MSASVTRERIKHTIIFAVCGSCGVGRGESQGCNIVIRGGGGWLR
jgi:hypothetical protein